MPRKLPETEGRHVQLSSERRRHLDCNIPQGQMDVRDGLYACQ